MRVAMYYTNQDVRLEEMAVPRIGPGEMLVQVEASGICGSDVMEWYRRDKAPLVLGHEVAGVIEAVGEGVSYRRGQRVALIHHIPCQACHYCLTGHPTVCDTFRHTHFDPGGFAEYIRVPAINVERGVYPLPDDVSFEEATFLEPLACVVRGQRLAHLQAGQCVLVLGSGIAGALHIQLARAQGASPIVATDVAPFRLDAARRLGADVVLHAREDVPARVREANGGRLADLVIVSTGAAPALDQALRSVERGGTVLFFAPTAPGAALPLPFNDLWANEVTITTSYGPGPEAARVAMQLISGHRLRLADMVTHRLGLAETGRGFRVVGEGGDSLKVIIEPHR